jgi:hypothetical protein
LINNMKEYEEFTENLQNKIRFGLLNLFIIRHQFDRAREFINSELGSNLDSLISGTIYC